MSGGGWCDLCGVSTRCNSCRDADTRCINPRCRHDAQVHGADKCGMEGGRLTPDGPRGQGACTARCWCQRYVGRAA